MQFTIVPKPGSVTQPVSVTYSKNYLAARGFISGDVPQIMLPIFGLYANYLNTVIVSYLFTNSSAEQQVVMVPTPAFADPCGFNKPTVIQPRTTTTDASYDYILLKNSCGPFSPTIMDTDGEIRWVGIANVSDLPSTIFQNSVYLAHGPTVYRMEFDGAVSLAPFGGGIGFHHNIDHGKRGIILDEDVPGLVESVNAEVDAQGNILKTWNLATIISNAMTAGGDDPSNFVFPQPADWFHNNAVAYRKSDDSLVISSRENFVICIDYDSGAIKWILGDPTKKWFQFASLRSYALSLGNNTLPPIGQHAVSFTDDDKLLLFDDGQNSLNQTPPGEQRSYSAPRQYDIDLAMRVATEVWNYPNAESLFSPFCSSVYEDAPDNYLVDYAIISNLGTTHYMELLGLGPSGATVFDYRYQNLTTGCDAGWNAIPAHLDGMRFTTIVPLSAVSRKTHGTAGTFDVPLPLSGRPGIECRSGGADSEYQVVITFPTSVTAPSATVTSEAGKSATVSGPPIANGDQVTVNLSHVTNAQTITVNLIGLTDGVTTDTISVPMSVLVGDVTGNASVNSSDVSKTKLQIDQPVTASTYRYDVTTGGLIALADVFLIESLTGTAIQRP